MEKEYYERYWASEIADKKGFANLPPQRDMQETSRIVNILKPYASGRVLDAGCGDGSLSNRMLQLPMVTEVVGIDISDGAIHIAQSKYPRIQYKVGQVTDLPFESNFFDAVVAIELVEHVYDTQLMFKEFSRVLKNGGTLIITTTDFNLLKKAAIALLYWDRYFCPTNPHIRFYSKKSLEAMLCEFGFKKVSHWWNGAYFRIMPKGQVMIAKKL
jgi:ubiquinone/menaquinone biosynthesis C-methylase UbiE